MAFSDILWDGVERGLKGENSTVVLTSNPNDLLPTKLGKTIPCGKGIYTAIVGEESSGKTSFADSFYVLNPFLHARRHGGTCPHTIYRSFERPKPFKLAKWLAYIIFYETGAILPTELILSWATKPRDLSEQDVKLIQRYLPVLDELEQFVELIPGIASPEDVQAYAQQVAYQRGKFVEAKKGKLFVNGEFSADLSLSETRDGVSRKYYEGRLGRIWDEEKIYFAKDPKHVVSHVVDHISRYGEDKVAIDAHTRWVSGTARDLFSWQVIDLNQMNRTNFTNERGYYALQNVKNTGTMTADADVVIAVIDPAHLRIAQWAGYDIAETVHDGNNMFRGVQILKNSWGRRPMMGFYFTGAVGHYSELVTAEEMRDSDYHLIKSGIKKVF